MFKQRLEDLKLMMVAEAYEKAEEIRKEILAGSLRQSIAAIGRLDRILAESKYTKVEDLQTKVAVGQGGIASTEAIHSSNELIALMNEK